MTISKQIQLVSRIQADLRHESKTLRNSGAEMAASDCEGQAESLDCVISTLRAVAQISVAIEVITANNKSSVSEPAAGEE